MRQKQDAEPGRILEGTDRGTAARWNLAAVSPLGGMTMSRWLSTMALGTLSVLAIFRGTRAYRAYLRRPPTLIRGPAALRPLRCIRANAPACRGAGWAG